MMAFLTLARICSFFSEDDLLFDELVGQLGQSIAVAVQDIEGFVVGFFHQLAYLLVDDFGGLFAVRFGKGVVLLPGGVVVA